MLRLAGVVAVGLLLGTSSVVHAAPQSAQPIPQAPSLVAAPPVPNGAWTVYHHDNAHTGYDSTQPAVTGAAAGCVLS